MKRNWKNLLPMLLALVMVIAMCTGMSLTAFAAETVTLNGGETIAAGGTYQLAEDATGTITVSTTEAVTIIGNGAQWDSDPTSTTHGAVSSTANQDLGIVGSVAGIDLTLKDMYLNNSGVTAVDVTGTGNTLTFDGTVIIDQSNAPNIHVGPDAGITIKGTTDSRAYLYKTSQTAGIGGNGAEACGTIVFGEVNGSNDFYIFMKGSRQGAVIGSGANCSDVPGNITFNSGIYNLLGIARGAIISGSAGADSTGAGNVIVNGGLINMNVDFSGAAIGGGGYATGNDKSGGSLYVSGGSIRTYIDSNAVSNWSSYGVTEAGVNDAAITAGRVNGDGSEDVYLLTLDTAAISADSYVIKVDGETFYSGPRYSYSYYKENENRDTDGDGLADLATTPQGTPGNWVVMDESCFYLYLTGENHTVSVNGVETNYAWDAETTTFSVVEPVTYAWYEAGTETASYTISTADELKQFAAIVNGTDANYDKDTFVGKTVKLTADIDLSAVCSEDLGTWNAIGGAAQNVTLEINSQEELDAALYQYNIIYDNTGWSYKYGTDKNLAYDANKTYYVVIGQIFSGTFDGNGKTISNLYVLSTTGYAGLFGNVDGTLKNFTVKGSVTTATGSTEVDFVGGVTGKLSEGGRIERVTSYVNVDASAKAYNVGGIAGFNGTKDATASNAFTSANNTFIIECVNYGSVYGWSQVGGIAGENAGQILRCANYGDVDGLKGSSKAGIGGIAGRNGCNNTAYTSGTITDCYNFGTIATSDNKWCGGIAGFNNAASSVTNCYNVGTVYGAGQANAIVGQNEASGTYSVSNCWYLESTRVNDLSGVYGGNFSNCGPKTDAEMKVPAFAAILGENFNIDSDNINQGYPVLDWQGGTAAPAIYTVTIPASGTGYTVSIADGSSTTVIEGGSFSFSVYLLDGYEITSVKAGETELTAVGGVYTIENITSDVTVTIIVQEKKTVVYGDINGDGNVNATDAAMAYRIANSKLDPTEDQFAAADVNGDNVVNATDAALIYRYANSKLEKFPVENN